LGTVDAAVPANPVLAAISTLGKSIVSAIRPHSDSGVLKHIRMPTLSELPRRATGEVL
jgi:hypothetical protein